MSGGIIKPSEGFIFVKVKFSDGSTGWYISDFSVNVGDGVYAPTGKFDFPELGEAVEVVVCSAGKVTPVSPRAAKKLISVVVDE